MVTCAPCHKLSDSLKLHSRRIIQADPMQKYHKLVIHSHVVLHNRKVVRSQPGAGCEDMISQNTSKARLGKVKGIVI